MSEHMMPIPSRLYNAAVGGHVAGADQIIDDKTGLTLDKVTGGALEEKEYTSGSDNGMGRVVLRKNLVEGVNTLTQSMINKSNTIYVIQYDFTLGEDITVPANCILEFDGGSVSGAHTLTGNNTGINAGLVKIFNTDVTLVGTWNVTEAYPEWFGAKGDGVTDDCISINKLLNFTKNHIGIVAKFISDVYAIKQAGIIAVDSGISNIIIKGNGSLLDASSIEPSVEGYVINLKSAETIYIEGISLVGKNTDTLGSLSGINISGCKKLLVNNVKIKNFGNVGFETFNPDDQFGQTISEGCEITNSEFSYCAYANLMISGNNLRVENCLLRNAGRNSLGNEDGYGIVLAGYNNTIVNCRVENNNRYGIDVRNSSNICVRGNYLYNNGVANIYGIAENTVKKFAQVIISDNNIDGNGASITGMHLGINGQSTPQPVGSIIIANNILKNIPNVGGAINIKCDMYNENYSLDMLTITGNTLENANSIWIDNSANGNIKTGIFSNNTLKNSGLFRISNVLNVICSTNSIFIDNSASLDSAIVVISQHGSVNSALVVNNIINSNGTITTPISISANNYVQERNLFNGVNINESSAFLRTSLSFRGETKDVAVINVPWSDCSALVVAKIYGVKYGSYGKAVFDCKISISNVGGTVTVTQPIVTSDVLEAGCPSPSINIDIDGATGTLKIGSTEQYVAYSADVIITCYGGDAKLL